MNNTTNVIVRSKTGTKLHRNGCGGQGPTNCGIRFHARIVAEDTAESREKYAKTLCDKCFPRG